MPAATPLALTDHRASGVLEIGWSDGLTSRLPHPLLRAQCRCAGCEQRRRRDEGDPPADAGLRLVHIEPVGEHGVTLGFSDGHARGIYPWTLLRQLGAA